MITKVSQIPEIPAGLREAAARTTLVPFIGAGASVLAGCPGWKDFADKSLRWLVDQGKFTHSQLAQISHLHPRIKLSLARTIAEEQRITIPYKDILHSKEPRESPKGRRLYNSLFRLGNVLVTTNYDVWLDEWIPEPTATATPTGEPATLTVVPMNVVYGPERINSALLSQLNTVVHLHGSVHDAKTMIMTTSDYIGQYAAYNRSSRDPETENRLLTFLQFLFRNRTVLFIGYGLLKEVKYKLETCKKDHSKTCATVKGLRGSAIIRPIQEYAALDHIMKEFRGDIVSSDWAPRSYLDWMLAIAAYHNKYPSQDECLKRLQRGDPESAAYECGKPERISSDLDSDGLYFEHDIFSHYH